MQSEDCQKGVSHVGKSPRHRAWRFFVFSFALIGSLESPPSISLKATRKLGCTDLVRDSRVRD